MKNPFEYGGVVDQRSFCNRVEELSDLRRTIDNADRLFLYAERRMGKTSLVKHLLRQLPEEAYVAAYVDLWPTDGAGSFAQALAKAVAEARATTADRLLKTARRLFSSLRPSVTFDEHSGAPVLTFGAGVPDDAEPELMEALEAPGKVAAETEQQVIIVFDEFQRIAEYDDDRVERRLRSVVQQQGDVAYLFLGSRKHLIQEMFLSSERPLYRSAAHYPLQPIDEVHWQPFIQERFEDAGKHIPETSVRQLHELTGGHPFYVQHLCHALWERCPEGGSVDADAIDEAVSVLLRRESYAYTTLWESLTLNQRRFMRGLATAAGHVQPFSADFLQHAGVQSPSTAQRVAEALLTRDLIDRENGSFIILDRFLRLWIQRSVQG